MLPQEGDLRKDGGDLSGSDNAAAPDTAPTCIDFSLVKKALEKSMSGSDK